MSLSYKKLRKTNQGFRNFMVLVVILIVFGFLGYLFFVKNNLSDKKDVFIYKQLIINFSTVLIIVLAIVQSPLFYYYTYGLFSLFIMIPYLLFSLVLTVVLLIPLIKRKKLTRFQKYGVITAILIGISSFVFGSEMIEKLDWKLRVNERNLIIEKVLNGKIKGSKLKMNSFPPISNGGNEIFIDHKPKGTITVTFFIDRGFLDHYSAFIYTTDSSKIRTFESKINSIKNRTNKKIDNNWYRISE